MGLKRGTEADVLAACLQALRLWGVFAWRNNTGAFAVGEGRGRRFFRAGAVGSGDILGVAKTSHGGPGRFLSLEVKSSTGKLRPAQAAWLDAVRAAGGIAFVVRSVADLEAGLRAEGVI